MKKSVIAGFLFGIILFGMIGFVVAEENYTNTNVTVTPSCTDSDGGINYYVKGKVISNDLTAYGIQEGFIEDRCSSEKILQEWYCKNMNTSYDGINYISYLRADYNKNDCPNGCKEGKCLCPTTKCADGTVYGAEKCSVKDNVCICPSCPAVKPIACSAMPTCEGAKDTGQKDINGCPIYSCQATPVSSTTPICQPTKCSDGRISECRLVNNHCVCSTCPTNPVDFYISGTEGIKKTYFPSEILNLMIKGVESDGTPASSEEGFNIQFYIDEWPLVQGQGSKGDNAYYKEGYWYGSISVLDKLTSYRLQLFLYCSRDNSICSKKYGIKGAQVENTYYFSIISGGEKVSEQVTCVFSGMNNNMQVQKCYTAEQNSRAYCSNTRDSQNCAAQVQGYKGEKLTWKSSCGGYQYTIQDGNDEKIEFDCKSGETTETQIKNKGFKNVYFQCYDGAESKSTEREACKSSDYWKKFAANFCGSHCENNPEKCKQKYENQEDINKCLGKCGVNSFSIGAECYIEETLTTIPVATPVETIPSTPAEFETGTETTPLKEEPALMCKDSCPLDGKCYPFGYRKSGEYCTDKGSFETQLKSDEKCDNNFECSSNVCVSGKCISEGFIEKIMNWFKRLFGGG
ncbi:MAG: hypothetical protein AABX54_00540 [Nanoarchaeota archaeon]